MFHAEGLLLQALKSTWTARNPSETCRLNSVWFLSHPRRNWKVRWGEYLPSDKQTDRQTYWFKSCPEVLVTEHLQRCCFVWNSCYLFGRCTHSCWHKLLLLQFFFFLIYTNCLRRASYHRYYADFYLVVGRLLFMSSHLLKPEARH